MGKLYDIFKASKLGAGAAPDFYTALIGQSLSKGSAQEYELTDVPPLVFNSNGQAINTWTIWGNTVQDSVPTPLQPVDVLGVGTLDHDRYKISVSCGGTSQVIYLDNTQSTRRIKKKIIDGTEGWFVTTESGTGKKRAGLLLSDCIPSSPAYCSHYQYAANNAYPDIDFFSVNSTSYMLIGIETTYPDAAAFKAYLAAQYANGTPVVVYYVLTAATTGTINESLMKIGNYADSISNATSIPTAKGSNTLTIDTDIQPSQMYIKYYK